MKMQSFSSICTSALINCSRDNTIKALSPIKYPLNPNMIRTISEDAQCWNTVGNSQRVRNYCANGFWIQNFCMANIRVAKRGFR